MSDSSCGERVARTTWLSARNERCVTVIDGGAGRCGVVIVAAVGAGHITASHAPEVDTHGQGFATGTMRRRKFASPLPVARGQE
ncbi:MAG: hypothetical protein JXP73_08970 [Deltaproteobacteria bacterium]|nr:hypothetical protein [Deltaproteobacteria bacterium]